MSLNPEISNLQEPVRQGSEQFVLRRSGLTGEITGDGLETLTSQGTVYLTTERLIFVCSSPTYFKNSNVTLTGFDIPLQKLEKERFNQPIFGCNNLSGNVYTAAKVRFKLYFKTGGAGVFLPVFRETLHQVRQNMIQQELELKTNELFSKVKSMATTDPSDPSVVYIS